MPVWAHTLTAFINVEYDSSFKCVKFVVLLEELTGYRLAVASLLELPLVVRKSVVMRSENLVKTIE